MVGYYYLIYPTDRKNNLSFTPFWGIWKLTWNRIDVKVPLTWRHEEGISWLLDTLWYPIMVSILVFKYFTRITGDGKTPSEWAQQEAKEMGDQGVIYSQGQYHAVDNLPDNYAGFVHTACEDCLLWVHNVCCVDVNYII